MIEVRDLVKRYGGHTAVDHLSFTVEKGRIYGFLGPNGAGKSTTMNIMTGYIGPTEGEVIINGHNILDEPEEAKRAVGYLPELPPLYPDMTPAEYLRFAAELKGIPKGEIAGAVEKVVGMTMIADVKDRLIKNLSKGYRQRVGLAQAILGMPEILILDEPTVGLDPKQIHEIRALIRSLAADHTIILSSHILSEVQEVCDQVLIIHHGKLIATGTPQELEKQLRGNSLELTVKAPDAETVSSVLKSVEGAGEFGVSQTGTAGEFSVTLTPKESADLREAVFYACANAGCPILMMRPSGVSLENIFLELTDDAAVSAVKPKAAENTPEEGGKA